jgi:aminoglycoside phosphotransferase (APT) family kinase protein
MAFDIEQTADALLTRLRAELAAPGLSYREAPVRLTGGYDTLTLRFALDGAKPPMDGQLVGRLFGDTPDIERAGREAAIHQAVAAQGYPAPPILHLSQGLAPPGAFVVMPLVPGVTLRHAMGNPRTLWKSPVLLARLHARLHALDASMLPLDERSRAMADWPRMLSAQADDAGVGGFGPALAWAARNAPTTGRRSILHLDFHPGNVMVADGKVTAVLDWANGTTGDPASDVGTTMALLTMGPVEAPAVVTPVLNGIRKWLARRYAAEYLRLSPLPPESIRYYEARRCLTAMLHVAIRRAGSTLGERDHYAWDGSQQVRNMRRRFEAISGVKLPVL